LLYILELINVAVFGSLKKLENDYQTRYTETTDGRQDIQKLLMGDD